MLCSRGKRYDSLYFEMLYPETWCASTVTQVAGLRFTDNSESRRRARSSAVICEG